MANETPHHIYREITDDHTEGHDAAVGWCASLLLFIVSVPLSLGLFLLLLIFCNWQISAMISISVFVLIIIFGLFLKYGYDKTSPRLKESEKAKRFLDYDFGTVFTLRTTYSHDYEEILLDFSQESFLPLMNFCKKLNEKEERIDSVDEITIKKFLPHIKVLNESFIEWEDELGMEWKDGNSFSNNGAEIKNDGFTKIESYYNPNLSNDNNLWIKSQIKLEVDYNYRTLKMSYTVW